MVSKELLEKAKKCTTREEILELAKKENVEVSEEEIKTLLASFCTNRELSDEELENVSGGGCTSSETYDELGMTHSGEYQFGWNHPLIVTAFNSCDLGHGEICGPCGWSAYINGILYCKARSEENDPCNGGVKYGWNGEIIQHF